MKLCIVYALETEYLVMCSHETIAGFHVVGDPVQRVSRSEPVDKLGCAVLEVLQASKENAPIPTEAKSVPPALLDAGIKSWKALAKRALSCAITFGPVGVAITPQRRDEKGNYFPISEAKSEAEAMAAAVGSGILTALKYAS